MDISVPSAIWKKNRTAFPRSMAYVKSTDSLMGDLICLFQGDSVTRRYSKEGDHRGALQQDTA